MGDFSRDTAHLTMLQRGAYNDMLDYYYATGKPLPAAPDQLYRIARAMNGAERKAVDAVAGQFFPTQSDGKRHNKRADIEIAKHEKQAAINRELGKKGGRPKTESVIESVIESETESVSESETESVSESKPNDNPNHSQIKETTTTAYSAIFEETWGKYPRRDGDNPKRRAWKAWRARLGEGHVAEELRDGVQRYAAWVRARGHEGTERVKQAATFFGPDKAFLIGWEITESNVSPLYRREGMM